MNYMFPSILHIDDIRPAIAGRTDFIVAERDWGYVVNYLVAMPDSFPPVLDDTYHCPGCNLPMSETVGCSSQRCPELISFAAIRLECRGMLFYRAGNILSRRVHKFFNVNEKEETLSTAASKMHYQDMLLLLQYHIVQLGHTYSDKTYIRHSHYHE